MSRRVVFDTTTVLSALLSEKGRLAWLRTRWREGHCLPLICRATATELTRVLSYPKFQLSVAEQQELLADYLPCCETVDLTEECPVICRDPKDQPFLDLAQSGRADFLVSGDQDILVLANSTSFVIETPESYRRRIAAM